MMQKPIDYKEIFHFFAFSILFLVLCVVMVQKKSLYPETAIVSDIQQENDEYIITFTVSNGNMFQYVSKDGDIEINEIYSLLMDSNYTKTVKDDKIKEIRYTAF